jgi:two-component system, cell cycle sensor histidine kinase and response regulator CckA
MKQPSRLDESPRPTPYPSPSEQNLRESEARFRSLVLATAQAIWTAGPDGRLTSDNPSWEAFTGLTSQESMDFGWLKAVHPEDHQLTLSAWNTAVANTASYSIEHRLKRHDGQWRYMLTRAVPVFDEDGKVREWMGASTDVTERKRAEFRSAVFSFLGQRLSAAKTPRDAARIILDAADQLIGWDSCFLDSYSSERDVINHILAMDLMNGVRTEVGPSGDGGEPTATMRKVLAEGAQLILRENLESEPIKTLRFGDKNRPAASLMFAPIRSSLKVAGFLSIQSYKLKAYSREDLKTLQSLADYCGGALERIQSEEALHAYERKYLHLFDRNPSPLLVYDVETLKVLAVNEAAIHHYGYSREEFLAMTLKDYRPPEDVPLMLQKMQTMGDGLQQVGTFRHRKKDGTIILADINSHSLTFEGRKARLVMMTDITERKKVEDNLVRLATAVEQSTDIIIHLDLHGTIEYVNPAFERVTGYSRSEVVRQHINSLPQDGEPHFEFTHAIERVALSGSWSGHFVFRRKGGKRFEADVSISPIRDVEGKITGYIVVERDVTKEVALEEQVRLAQKMEAIGLLAGGVAHDFNNLLQVIIGYTMLARGAAPHELEHHLEQVQKAAERATTLTRQLLAFGRRQAMQKTDSDLNQLVADHLTMLRRLIGENIEVHLRAGNQLGNVFADKGQLEQVLLNLCVNARDAMPHGGRLTIETQNTLIDQSFCENHPWARPGNFALLTVADTGVGMDRETLSRIFEPFFTTKPKGRGTGLGLSVVYGIIRQHEGLVHVYSELGLGTTFKIYLPTTERITKSAEKMPLTVPPGGTETILLAEDEPMVRDLAIRTLQRAGYRVVAASNGEETCELFKLHAKEIDLLLLDVVMPKLGGREAFDRIRETHPDVRVLFCSGYSGNSLEAGYFQVEGLQLLQKPYGANDLLLKVRELLDKKRK